MKQEASITELVVGVIAVMSLAVGADAYSFRNTIVGIILVLFVVQGFWREKRLYPSILFSAIFAVALLVAIGKPVDFCGDEYFYDYVSRDVSHFLLWLLISVSSLILDRIIQAARDRNGRSVDHPQESRRETIHEVHAIHHLHRGLGLFYSVVGIAKRKRSAR